MLAAIQLIVETIMIKDIVKNVSKAIDEGFNFSQYISVDKNWNICLTDEKPQNAKFNLGKANICWEGKKIRQEKKLKATQEQLANVYGLALKTDVERLEKEIAAIKRKSKTHITTK